MTTIDVRHLEWTNIKRKKVDKLYEEIKEEEEEKSCNHNL